MYEKQQCQIKDLTTENFFIIYHINSIMPFDVLESTFVFYLIVQKFFSPWRKQNSLRLFCFPCTVAVKDASDDGLFKLGLRAKGDMLAFRGCCHRMNVTNKVSDNSSRKKVLIECIKSNGRISKEAENTLISFVTLGL